MNNSVNFVQIKLKLIAIISKEFSHSLVKLLLEKKLGKTGLDNFTQGKITSTGMCTQNLCKILPKCEFMFD